MRIVTWNVNFLRSRIDRVEALLQRHDIEDVQVGFDGMPGYGEPVAAESRAIGAVCGGSEARQWLGQDIALVGDWNVAPRDEDVFDVAQFKNSTHVTPRERAAFQAFLDDGWADVVRPHAAGPDVYTYWDYYRQRFERDRGLKIDFVLASPPLASRVTGAFIDRDERAGTGASDHAPVVVDLEE